MIFHLDSSLFDFQSVSIPLDQVNQHNMLLVQVVDCTTCVVGDINVTVARFSYFISSTSYCVVVCDSAEVFHLFSVDFFVRCIVVFLSAP